jgi:putative membrane protein
MGVHLLRHDQYRRRLVTRGKSLRRSAVALGNRNLPGAPSMATLRNRRGPFDGRPVRDMHEPDSKPPTHAHVPEEKRATEYLANERTFLAWIRTSISVISFGFLITRVPEWIHRSHAPAEQPGTGRISTSFVIGLGMMAFGAVGSVLAAWRYHNVNRAIEEGRVKPDRGLVILVTVLVVLLATGMISFMLLNE